MTRRLSGTVTEIWRLKYWTHGRRHRNKDGRWERKRGRGDEGKRKGKWKEKIKEKKKEKRNAMQREG